MGLTHLTLRDFRTFSSLEFTPDRESVTVLVSPNGTGKTSVLEAIFALATAGSFRTTSGADLIRARAPYAEVHGVLENSGRRVQIDLVVERTVRGSRKRMLVNGQRPQSRLELGDALPLTVFTPEGVDVIRQGPEHRRGLVDHLLVDEAPLCAPALERYAHILSQRNAVLRRFLGGGATPADRDELATWSADLVEAGTEVVELRRGLIARLVPHLRRYHQELAGSDEEIAVTYDATWSADAARTLDETLDDDIARGHTTRGPHRDDLRIFLAGRDTRRQASQGEQRTLALALRLAGHQVVVERRRVSPVILLDDVFSELDAARSERLLALLPGGQTIVTTAVAPPRQLATAAIVDVRQGTGAS